MMHHVVRERLHPAQERVHLTPHESRLRGSLYQVGRAFAVPGTQGMRYGFVSEPVALTPLAGPAVQELDFIAL